MAERDILEYPDPRLRLVAQEVDRFDAELVDLAGDLTDTLRARGGIGLAAPQIGASKRVLVTDPSGEGRAVQVYVNPVVLATSAIGFVEESCLSLPGVSGNVIRATEARVQAHDLEGKPFACDLSAMDAVCIQHEIDHLDGRLFVDRLSLIPRLRFRWANRTRERVATTRPEPVSAPGVGRAAHGA